MVQDRHQMLENFISSSTRSASESPDENALNNKSPSSLHYFPCDGCDRVFTDQGHQQRHQRVHSSAGIGSRAHACSECGKTFATSSGLKQHQHIHSSVKPFQCEVCLRAYTQFSNLCRHKRMHADCRQQIKCKDCGQAFSTTTSLGKHRRFCEGILKGRAHLQQTAGSFPSDFPEQSSPAAPSSASPEALLAAGMTPNLAAAYYNYIVSQSNTELNSVRHLYPSVYSQNASDLPLSPGSVSLYPQYTRLMTLMRAGLISPQSTNNFLNWSTASSSSPSEDATDFESPGSSSSVRHLIGSRKSDEGPQACKSRSSAWTENSRRDSQISTPPLTSPVKAEATPMASNPVKPRAEIKRPWMQDTPAAISQATVDSKHPLNIKSEDNNNYIAPSPCHTLLPRDASRNTKLRRPFASRPAPYQAPALHKSHQQSPRQQENKSLAEGQDHPLDLTFRQSDEVDCEKCERDNRENGAYSTSRQSTADIPSRSRTHTETGVTKCYDTDVTDRRHLPAPSAFLPLFATSQRQMNFGIEEERHMHSLRYPTSMYEVNKFMSQDSMRFLQNATSPSRHDFDVLSSPPMFPHLQNSSLSFALARPPSFSGLMAKFEQQSRAMGLHQHDGSLAGSCVAASKCRDRYGCKFCGKVFPRSANLTRHLRTHTGEQPYKCKYCERSFSISSNLQRHVRNIHNKEKPFKCPLCERCFGQQTNLDRHLKRHDSDSGAMLLVDSPQSIPAVDDELDEEDEELEDEEDVLSDEDEEVTVTGDEDDDFGPPTLTNERGNDAISRVPVERHHTDAASSLEECNVNETEPTSTSCDILTPRDMEPVRSPRLDNSLQSDDSYATEQHEADGGSRRQFETRCAFLPKSFVKREETAMDVC